MEEVRCKQYAGSTFSSLTLYNAKQAVGVFYAKNTSVETSSALNPSE